MALINHIINAFYAILKWPMSFKAHVMLSVSPYKFNQPVQRPCRKILSPYLIINLLCSHRSSIRIRPMTKKLLS